MPSEEHPVQTTHDDAMPDTNINYFWTAVFISVVALILINLIIGARQVYMGERVGESLYMPLLDAGAFGILLYFAWSYWSEQGYLPKVISRD